MSATELAEAIRSRQVSSQDVIQAHLERIEAVNGSINAVVIVMAEQALKAARAADRAVAAGADLGPFHGVPFTVKENIDVAGTPTTQGFKALADAYPRDAPVVERLRAAEGIPIGRTNLPSGGVRWHCESELWGTTVNPWDSSRTPGASSAGRGAASVAPASWVLGMTALDRSAIQRNVAGSARSRHLGRIPRTSTVEATDIATIGMQLAQVNGPLARRVADLRAAFDVIAGPIWRDRGQCRRRSGVPNRPCPCERPSCSTRLAKGP